MHIAVNGWFWDRPDTGSGQYLRRLLATFAEEAPDLKITLILPEGREVDTADAACDVKVVPLPGSGHRAKVRFEQRIFPAAAAQVGANLGHVPYWGSPMSSPVPVVVTIHDLIPMLLPAYRGGVLARLYTSTVAASARGAAAVITDSVASKVDIIRHLGLPAARVHAIPLAAGDRFQPEANSLVNLAVRKKYRLPAEFVLYLGGYDVRKNVETLLRAYTYVQTGLQDAFPLVLAGKPPEKQSPRFTDVNAWVDALNLHDVVRIIGWIDDADTPALYRMASCFVFPSRYEGFGLPPLEAMACGTPVVACSTSSIPEVVGDAGFLVEPDDERHMAGAILAILNQPETASDLSQKALIQAGRFSWSQTAAKTREVYEKALANT